MFWRLIGLGRYSSIPINDDIISIKYWKYWYIQGIQPCHSSIFGLESFAPKYNHLIKHNWLAGRFSFNLFLLRKKYYLQIKRCHKPENACGTLSLKTTVEPFYLLSCEAKTNSKQWECKQWQYITRSPWKVAQDCLVCSDGGALALVVSLALMMEGKHIIHIKKMYIFIIYAWER